MAFSPASSAAIEPLLSSTQPVDEATPASEARPRSTPLPAHPRSRRELLALAERAPDAASLRALLDEACARPSVRHRVRLVARELAELTLVARRRGLVALEVEIARRATELCPDAELTFRQLGKALLGAGDPEGALEAYDRAVELGGALASEQGRAEALVAMGKLDEALAALEALVEARPFDLLSRCRRADVLGALGRFEEALAAYDQLASENPFLTMVLEGRAHVRASLGAGRH